MGSKADETRRIKSDASQAKSRLMDALRDLERIGASTAARELDRIIYRLEAWQNK